MTKKISAILLSVLMMAVFIPAMSFAADSDYETVIDKNGLDLTSLSSYGGINDAIGWNSATKLLTLRGNVYQNQTGEEDGSTEATAGARFTIKVPAGTKIQVEENTNIYVLGSTNDDTYGIYAVGSVEYLKPKSFRTERETLNIHCAPAGSNKTAYGIYTPSADAVLPIEGMPNLNIYGVTDTDSNVIGIRFPYITMDQTIDGGETHKTHVNIDLSGNAKNIYGIYSEKTGNVDALELNNSELKIRTGNATGSIYGIYAKARIAANKSKIDVKTGELTGTAGNTNVAIYTSHDFDFNSGNSIYFTNSDVSADAGNITTTGGAATDEGICAGIYAIQGNFGFSNGNLHAVSGNVPSRKGTWTAAIYADDFLNIEQATADATAGYAKGTSDDAYAIYCGSSIVISSCDSFIAKAGSSANATNEACIGIFSVGQMSITNSHVKSSAELANTTSSALYSALPGEGYVYCDKSTLDLHSSEASNGDSIAMHAGGSLEASGSAISAEAGKAKYDSTALFSYGYVWDWDDDMYHSITSTNTKFHLISAKSDAGSSYGLYSNKGCVYLENGSDISATAGQAYKDSAAMNVIGHVYSSVSEDAIYVSESKLNLTAGNATTGSSYGLYSIYEYVSIGGVDYYDPYDPFFEEEEHESSYVVAKAGNGAKNSGGIYVDNTTGYHETGLDIENSEVSAEAGTAGGAGSGTGFNRSVGIFVRNGDISTNEAKVVAKGGAGAASFGIYARKTDDDIHDWGHNYSDIRFDNSDISANAAGSANNDWDYDYGSTDTAAIWADGSIYSNSQNTPASKGTIITGLAGTGRNSPVIGANEYINMYETEFNLHNNGNAYCAYGIQAGSNERGITGKDSISLQDCFGNIVLANDGSEINGIYSGSDDKTVITNCDIDIDLNGSGSSDVYGIGGCDVLITNPSNDITIDAVGGWVTGLYAYNDVKVKGNGKLAISADGDYTCGMYVSKKVVLDKANVDITSEDDGIYSGDGVWDPSEDEGSIYIKKGTTAHINSECALYSCCDVFVGDESNTAYLQNAVDVSGNAVTKLNGKLDSYDEDDEVTILYSREGTDGVNIRFSSSYGPEPYNPGGGGGGSVTPTEPEKPTPVPENIDINVDPVPAGTELNSETVGDNIVIKDKDKTLVEGKDYVVSVDKGTASTVGYKAVSVIGKGDYNGISTTTYIKVLPKRATIKTVTAGTEKVTFKWKKVAGADNYVVRIATNKSFTKNKVVKYTKGTTTSKTFKNLVPGKKYFVQVRVLKKNIENPTTHKLEKFYGKWSKVKSITVK